MFCVHNAGSAAFQWVDSTSAHIDACTGQDLEIPWEYTVGPADIITSIQWVYQGSSGDEMVATEAMGAFLTAPTFSGLAQRGSTNGGLVLNHVTPATSGNYSVVINLQGSNGPIKRSVAVTVSSGLPTTDGQLHISQESDVVQDHSTGQLSLLLKCGRFLSAFPPSYSMEWLTPSGQLLQSSSYQDGFFCLWCL